VTTVALRARRRSADLRLAVGGLVVFGACALVAHNGRVGPAERRVFRAINDLPSWLYRPMWIFQQVGNLAVAVVLVLVLALVLRRWKLAAAAVIAVVAKLGLERMVKSLVERQRPGTSVGGVHLRGNVPIHGLSFVSGHAVITAAMATIVAPLLPGRWKWLPWVLVALNGIARVYVGAHNPLDVVGGVALGVFIGGTLNAVMAPSR
jgi:membrane-associated phospholipid phosphatase